MHLAGRNWQNRLSIIKIYVFLRRTFELNILKYWEATFNSVSINIFFIETTI